MSAPDSRLAEVKAATALPSLIGQEVTLRRAGRLWCTLCPFHGEKTPSFYVWPDHFHCYGCGAHGDVLDWLQRTRRMSLPEAVRYLGGDAPDLGNRPHSLKAPAAAPPPDDGDRCRAELARTIWREAVPASDSPVVAYLAGRGLRLPDDAPLRFHPACPRGAERCPAMVALMTDAITGEPCGLHRTFVAIRDGGVTKAAGKAKMMLGRSGVVRLVPDEWVGAGLGIAEGIETALAVAQLIEWGPCWAAGSAGGIGRFPVIAAASTLTIFADADDSGVSVDQARACAARWTAAGRAAQIQIPPAGFDWLDAMRGVAA
jgi:putative DNA primase/helicase